MASTEERVTRLEERMETYSGETSLIREDIRELRGRFDRFELRLEARFDRIDDRFDRIDDRFDKFHDRLNRITAIAVGILVTMVGGFLGIIGGLLAR